MTSMLEFVIETAEYSRALEKSLSWTFRGTRRIRVRVLA